MTALSPQIFIYLICILLFFILLISNSTSSITCPTGYYPLEVTPGDERCFICPLGYFCNDGLSKSPCSAGEYADTVGSTSCTPCPETHWTNGILCIACRHNEFCNGISRVVCNYGEYYNTTENICKPCNGPGETGYYCKNGYRHLCPPGHYLSDVPNHNEKLCLECPVGSMCPGEGERIVCTGIYYQDQPGQTNCSACGVGSHTDGRGVYCLLCGQNDDCDGISMTRCPPGTYMSGSSCLGCEIGFYCVDAKRFPCSPGTYSGDVNITSCENCPRGTYLPTSRGEAETDCLDCPPGTYSDRLGNAFPCTSCPKGSWSNITRVDSVYGCISCPAGYYQDEIGQTEESSCKPCPKGTYSPERSSICIPCAPGSVSDVEAATECVHCDPGSYAKSPGMTECTLCEPGSYQSEYNSSSCVKCEHGGNSEFGAIDDSVCTECVAGYYLNDTSCLPCPKGTYSVTEGALECEECVAGTYLPFEGGDSADLCELCPLGHYSNVIAAGECQACTPGQFLNKEGATENECEICPEGTFSPEGASECEECPVGYYSDTPESGECTPCPKGWFGNLTASTECMPCPAGSYSDELGSTICILCPAGTYGPDPTGTSINACKKCPRGTYSSTLSATSIHHCEKCPRGTFCDVVGMSEPKKCPKGTYSTIEGSERIYDCTSCPPGTYGPKEGAISENDCEGCPLGRYNPNPGAVFLHECIYCSPGMFSSTEKASDESACLPCPEGTYSVIASSICSPCPLGTFNEHKNASSLSYCLNCPDSRTTRSVGSDSPDDCLFCDPGHFLTDDFKCESCPLGTYFNESLGYTSEACVPCGKGHYQPDEFQDSPSSCLECPTGSYGPNEANGECFPCGKGKYSEVPLSDTASNCIECPEGTWSSQELANSSLTCIPCSPGTYSSKKGASDASACKLCPIGTKSEQQGSTTCIPCTSSDACFFLGNSFELHSRASIEEVIRVFDPKSLITGGNDSYLTLKLSIPFGVFGLVVLLIFILVIILLVFYRCQYAKLLRKFDIFFSMKHYVRIGRSQVKRPSVLGGVLSMIVFTIFLGFFTSIFLDFIINNKMVLENFLLENSDSVYGDFSFEVFVVGVHSSCNADITITGFKISNFDYSCKQSNEFTSDGLNGCLCSYTCLNCAPSGNSHQIYFNFDDYIMTHMIVFSIQVPHYISEQRYIVNGTMNSGNSILTGSTLPNIFSFSLNNARYISITDLAAFIEIFGINQETENKGYTIQLTGKFPGSSQPNDEDFTLSKGMQIVFDIQQSFGTYVSRETIRQNFFTFLAQVLTILSMLTVIGSLILGCIERRVYDVHRLMGKKIEEPPYFFPPGAIPMPVPGAKAEDDDNSSLYSKSSEEHVAVEEVPRSVEPFLLQKWRKQMKQRKQIVSIDGEQLAVPSVDDRSISDDTKSDATGDFSTVSAVEEKPRSVTNRFRYDPSVLLQDLKEVKPGNNSSFRFVLRPENSLQLFDNALNPDAVPETDPTIVPHNLPKQE